MTRAEREQFMKQFLIDMQKGIEILKDVQNGIGGNKDEPDSNNRSVQPKHTYS